MVTRWLSLSVTSVALALMMKGFLDVAVGGRLTLPGPPAMPIGGLLHPEALQSGEGLLCMGIVNLAALPAFRVVLALVTYLRTRAWVDALIALGVLAVLLLGTYVPRR